MICFKVYNQVNDGGLNPFDWGFTRAFDDPHAMEIVTVFKNALIGREDIEHDINEIKKKFGQ